MLTPAPAQAADAAPATEAAATPAAAPVEAAPVTTEAVPAAAPEPVNPGSLPMDIESIEKMFQESLLEPPPVQAAPAAPVTEAATAPAAAPVVPPEEAELPGRISTKQFEPEAQRAMKLQHALNDGKKPGDAGFVTLRECLGQIEAQDAKATGQPAAPVQPSPVEAVTGKVEEIKTNLAELREKRAELSSFGSDTTEIDAQIETAQESLVDAKLDLRLAERDAQTREAQQAQSAQEQEAQKRVAAKQAAQGRFPTAGDVKQPLGAKVAALVAEMKNPEHPDHSLLFATNAAVFITETAAGLVAQENAEKQGIPYAQAYAALLAPAPLAALPTPAAAAEPRRVLPASGAQGTTPAAAPLTERQMLDAIGTDVDKISAALGYGGGDWVIK